MNNGEDLSEHKSSGTMPELERNPWLTDSVTQDSGRCNEVTMETNSSVDDAPPESQASTVTVSLPSPVNMFENEIPFGPIYRPPVYKDVSDNQAEHGVCGLRNLGNTCFMNAGLQCLLGNSHLVGFFLQSFPQDTEFAAGGTPTNQFAKLLHKVWSGQFSTLNTSEFKETLGLYHPQFKDFRQHDCQEFLALLLDGFHEELNDRNITQENALRFVEQENVIIKNKIHETTSVASSEDKAGSVVERKESPLNNEVRIEKELGNSSASQGESLSNEKENPQFDESDSETPTIYSKSASLLSLGTDTTIKSNSEDSNQSSSSLQSSNDLHQSDSNFRRTESIPEEIQCFSDKAETTSAPLDSASISNDGRKIPTLEDIYMKDNKILNTNVLVTEFDEEAVTIDSEKYHKPDNTNLPPQEEFGTFLNDTASGIDELMQYETQKGNSFKPLKETNLLANHKDKYSGDTYSKKLFSQCHDPEDADCSINNIKRIKIDEEEKKEKNVRMQQLMKMNRDKSLKMIKVDTCEGIASSEERTVTLNLLDEQMLKQLSPQGGQRMVGMSQADIAGLGSPPAQITFNNEAHMWSRYLMESDREWQKYVDKNKSVIVDTFQGQFKSTVVCSECHHISVTFEPFMYLSVPLPHAMERQISVIFLPCDNKQPIRYLLTLNKNDKVALLKEGLRKLIKEESIDLVIAEVLSNHISRTLEDNVMLRYVNDESRTIYAFEMLPAPSISDIITNSDDVINSTGSDISAMLPNNAVSSSTISTAPADSTQDIFPTADIGMGVSDLNNSFDNFVSSSTSEQEVLNNSVCSSSGVSTSHTNLEFRTDVHWQTNLLNEPDTTSSSDTEYNAGANLLDSMPKFEDIISSTSDFAADQLCSSGGGIGSSNIGNNNAKSEDLLMECGDSKDVEMGNPTEENEEVDKWRSCAICLEEMTDNDLMIHTSCGGTLCHTCLDMSFKHYGEAAFICPVCSQTVIPKEDFVQVNLVKDYKPKNRILSVPVMQRNEEYDDCGKVSMSLFGHPNLLYLPSDLTGEMLYNHVDRVVPVLTNYNIVLTDGQGLMCSRCLYTDHCTGCPLLRECESLTLQPGDHLTVGFVGLDLVQTENSSSFVDHKSMDELRSSQPLTLFDCFTAFTQCEVLDEHNPWYCPRCCKNQCAHKTMTVWRYPHTLVVYLKRFVFHELTSTKIDNKVVFPLDDMDLSGYISGPRNMNLKYTLQSCVCHFGGVSSGHYTAYAKHPIQKKWCYYNDETTIHKQPQDEDYSSAYVLFYHRQGEDAHIKLPHKKSLSPTQEFSAKKIADNERVPASFTEDSIINPSSSLPEVSKTGDLNFVPTGYDFYS